MTSTFKILNFIFIIAGIFAIIVEIIIGTSYSLEYYDHYILPFLANVVKRDFDITIKDYTHVKFIYKLKG